MIARLGIPKLVVVLLHCAALSILVGYSLHHLLNEIQVIGILLLLSATLLINSLFLALKDKDTVNALLLFTTVMTASLIVTCYYLGIRGVIFIFPLVTSYFYYFPYRTAVLCGVLSSTLSSVALLNTVDPAIVIRFAIALALNLAFNISIAKLVYEQSKTLKKEAREDQLTGIANRRHFNELLAQAITLSASAKSTLCLLYLDLDNFKRINDTHGHSIGDVVLTNASKRLQTNIREEDALYKIESKKHVARLGGDEFAIILKNFNSLEEVKKIVERILKKMSEPYILNGLTFKCHASIGVAINSIDNESASVLMKQADTAMYYAKQNGKKRYQFFDDNISKILNEEQEIQKALQNALSNNLFILNYMPIFNAQSLQVNGVEVLIRTKESLLNQYGPEKYIPVAEQCGLIFDIDLWVIESTFIQIKECIKEDPQNKLLFSINISAKELESRDIAKKIQKLIEKHNVPVAQIEFEITESALVECGDNSIETLTRLKQLGVKLSLDDFGTGYTAFNQLRRYPVDTLKIDRSFVSEIQQEKVVDNCMAKVIVSMAKIYGVSVVAEGIENQEQLDYLQRNECDYLQGYYLGKPQSWSQFKQNFL